jgi:hypothetical protein
MLGCYQCQKQFVIDDVKEMSVDHDGNPKDMICPHCGVDSVIEQKEDQSDEDFKIMLSEWHDRNFHIDAALPYADWAHVKELRRLADELNAACLTELRSNVTLDDAFFKAAGALCVQGKSEIVDSFLAGFRQEDYHARTTAFVLIFTSMLVDGDGNKIRWKFHKKLYDRAQRHYPHFERMGGYWSHLSL